MPSHKRPSMLRHERTSIMTLPAKRNCFSSQSSARPLRAVDYVLTPAIVRPSCQTRIYAW